MLRQKSIFQDASHSLSSLCPRIRMQHSYFSVAVCILGILEDSTEAAARPDGNGLCLQVVPGHLEHSFLFGWSEGRNTVPLLGRNFFIKKMHVLSSRKSAQPPASKTLLPSRWSRLGKWEAALPWLNHLDLMPHSHTYA